MPEIYKITIEAAGIAFSPCQQEIPAYALKPAFDPAAAPAGLGLVCRMGAPELAHCMVFRQNGKPGGIFALHEQDELLFVALAENNLAYALAKSFFGELVSNVRVGVDIFDSSEDSDD